MSADTDTLIASLSSDLQPVHPPLSADITALLWLTGSAGFVIGITAWFGPIRPNALTQLATEARFLLETVLGVVAIASTAVMAFRTTVPGAATSRGVLIAIALMMLWLGHYVIGLAHPALEPSMLGKRDHCVVEALVFGLPPALLALLLSRRFYPLRPAYSTFLLCLAAAMLPALYMQIACMYGPAHILQMHILPALLVTTGGTLCAWGWVRIRR